MTNEHKQNCDRLLIYLKSILEGETRKLMDDMNNKEKLKARINLAKDLKRQGLEIPPDNIDIKW